MSERPRTVRIALRVVYWLAVLALSVAILVALILFLESRDSSSVGLRARAVAVLPAISASGRSIGVRARG